MLSTLLFIVLALIGVVVLASVTTGYLVSAPRYTGPVSDHFDGTRFYNLGGAKAKGFAEAIGWMLQRGSTRTPWGPFRTNERYTSPPASVRGNSRAGNHAPVRVTFINHSTVLLQFDGLNVLTDPVYYERTSPFQFVGPKRNRPPGVPLSALPKIDIMLLSHNHWDHLDIDTFKQLCDRDQPKIYCPLGVKSFLEKSGCQHITEMDWRQSVPYDQRTRIHCVPAQHFSGRGTFDRNATLWAGFIIDSQPVGKLYFMGDTGYGPFLKSISEQFGPIRLALIPIGAYKPPSFMAPVHCSPAEAVQIHRDIQSEQSVAIHFGTFSLGDDGDQEPIDALTAALQQTGVPAEQFRAL
ncbi:MAG: MBL fold metallo-hydrolase, partial [Bacteroidetes bacterium]|nr:MBL fold metallo-hydrolase [Fibrella sp.]